MLKANETVDIPVYADRQVNYKNYAALLKETKDAQYHSIMMCHQELSITSMGVDMNKQ